MAARQSFKTGVPGFTIGFAQPDDVPIILNFIKRLAEY